ncbi:unnamed protein product [Paramecium sonneborni]|uniref:Major vault protein n=1 Tax=Paramecium sonneborni TaxID=65129 RepID=A0A8S1PDP3_9CILI|nr:unnamed protein product [Paramecium sonneborni]
MAEYVTRIPPNSYIHVLDQNTNTARLEVGPHTFIRKEHESIIEGPSKMISLAPKTYCKIGNPILRDKKNQPVKNAYGEVEIQRGEIEYRTADDFSDPFPLFPGEKLEGRVEQLLIVQQNTALRLVALRDFEVEGKKKQAGEEWQRNGPFTYYPRAEEQIVEVVKAEVVKPNQALKLKATQTFIDKSGKERRAGQEWLIRATGSYLPDTFERVSEVVRGVVLTDKVCVHLRALNEFVDVYGQKRKPGNEWIITNKQAQVHITDVYEQLVGVEQAITLGSRNYCIIVNPYNEKLEQNDWGIQVLLKGEKTFFLQPGEELLGGKIEDIAILGEEEALLVQAIYDHSDEEGQFRKAGQRWIVRGPREYIPGVKVQVVEQRRAIPLDANEGIYVRDNRTGEVKEIKGKTYLLEAHESLWEKHLPENVELLVQRASTGQPYVPPSVQASGKMTYNFDSEQLKPRDKTRIISFKAPHNSAIQLYDYKLKKSRVVFGPDLVMLGPDEQFTVLKLSGGKPKQENLIQTLTLSLGPDFMTDQLIVETSDHAKLKLTLSYNWHFKVNKEDPNDAQKLFAVKDFVGDACKSIASRVRGAVSSITFEDFHNNSSIKIREAVFGKEGTEIRTSHTFEANNLVITSVDIQGQEITDEATRRQLSQSINLAIEISSRSQEMQSKHQASKLEQEAKGQLARQKLLDQAKAEETKIELLKQQAQSAKVRAEGEAVARAIAETMEKKIKAEAEVNQADLRSKAQQIEQEALLEQLKQEQEAELNYQRQLIELEIKKAKELSDIEIKKFKQQISAIGKETIIAMAKAGPETKAKLLGGLGLKGFLVTDGKNPINLFNTANGFIGENLK